MLHFYDSEQRPEGSKVKKAIYSRAKQNNDAAQKEYAGDSEEIVKESVCTADDNTPLLHWHLHEVTWSVSYALYV